MIYLYKKPK